MLTKNQICDIEISGLTSEGLGVGRHEGVAVFVKGAAPGDSLTVKIIKAERGYAYGRIEKIGNESPYRAEPPCPVYGKCGGCNFQHICYEAQIAAKGTRVEDSLRRIGGFASAQVSELISSENPLRYRNKSIFPVKVNISGQAVCGLFAESSHRLVPVTDCYLAHQGVAAVLRSIETYMNSFGISAYDEATHTGLIRHVMVRTAFTTGEVMVALVINGQALPYADKLIESLRLKPGVCSICVNVNRERTNVIIGPETTVLWGEPYIHEMLCGVTFAISAPSFFQVNTAMTEVLYDRVLDMAELTPSTTLIDAYCGIGTLSLIAARRAARVVGIESFETAVSNARLNAKLNNILNAEFVVGRSEDILADILQNDPKADVVILDPPRKGCDRAVISALRDFGPKRVVYVSCDPATLARDLKDLCGGDLYNIKNVVAVDTFAQTAHIETAVMLTRKTDYEL